MNEEAGFLASIQQTPADETARLVYADWLEERGDAISKSKADFIRFELQLSTAPEQSLNRVRWQNKLKKLVVDARWLAIVSHPRLEACRMQFEFECPKQWEKLTPTGDHNRRHCDQCQQDVHFCNSIREARNHAAQGHCVAVSPGVARLSGDLVPLPTVGIVRLTPDTAARVGRPRLELPIAPGVTPAPTTNTEPERSPRSKQPRYRRRNRSIERKEWEAEE